MGTEIQFLIYFVFFAPPKIPFSTIVYSKAKNMRKVPLLYSELSRPNRAATAQVD